jgi:hypothetical protein
MTAINNSISYQSQFASPGSSLNDMRTKSGAQSEIEVMKGVDLQPIAPNLVQGAPQVGELGKHVNLRA